VADVSAARDGPKARRPYDSPVRRQRAAETRERIVTAGSELAHEMASWNWRELTVRAVAERAGVGERTVYRHFPTERHLRNAVMDRLNDEAGVDYDAIDLANLGEETARILRSLQRFAAGRSVAEPDDPTFRAVDARRRAALLRAVVAETPTWTSEQQERVAGALDVLWNLPSYERLVDAWGLDGDQATSTVLWVIDLVTAAIRDGNAPPGSSA
jgi:AcrR family transcriptional regulator